MALKFLIFAKLLSIHQPVFWSLTKHKFPKIWFFTPFSMTENLFVHYQWLSNFRFLLFGPLLFYWNQYITFKASVFSSIIAMSCLKRFLQICLMRLAYLIRKPELQSSHRVEDKPCIHQTSTKLEMSTLGIGNFFVREMELFRWSFSEGFLWLPSTSKNFPNFSHSSSKIFWILQVLTSKFLKTVHANKWREPWFSSTR